MDVFSLATPEQVARTLAERLRALRLARGWKQVTLARRSGVSLASLRRFEESGRVSLENLLDLAFALNRPEDRDGHRRAARTYLRPQWNGSPRGAAARRASAVAPTTALSAE